MCFLQKHVFGAQRLVTQLNLDDCVVTNVANIDEALKAYLAGSLKGHVKKLH
jgi:hypothetical protein